jgi:purine-binding chemotaxis protein CheW
VDAAAPSVLPVGDPDDDDDVGAPAGGVVLRCAGSRYAVEMAAVAEVVPVPPVTRVPGTPTWLCGVVNWRGRVLAVVDLRPLVGAPLDPLPSSARLVVLSVAGVELGLLADRVPGLLECTPSEVQPAPATASGAMAALVRGVVDCDGPVAVLDTAAVVALRSQLPALRSVAP